MDEAPLVTAAVDLWFEPPVLDQYKSTEHIEVISL